jgi:hypothetical protein
MPEYDINSKDPLEMVRAVREKIYEETKHMTVEERMEYTNKKATACRCQMQEINLDDCDLSWLRNENGQNQMSVSEPFVARNTG